MKRTIVILGILSLLAAPIMAQEDEQKLAASAEEMAKANNPLADVTAFNLQNFYSSSLNDLPDGYFNSFVMRYTKPFGRWLWRLSAPITTISPAPGQTDTGLGDLDLFGAYLAIQEPKTTFGFGPSFSYPTATQDALGSGKWTAGLAAIVFQATPQFQYGALVQWRASFAGDDDREDVNVLIAQPLYFFQLGKGVYFRGAPAWIFDLESGDYVVPIGMGIGKVVKIGQVTCNFFIEPQPSILVYGTGQPTFQLFSALNMQF